jgi:hypothetical protein
MMKKVLVVMLVLGLASAANAAFSLIGGDGGTYKLGISETGTYALSSDVGENSEIWINIADTGVAALDGDPVFTGGNPSGQSAMVQDGEWYQISFTSSSETQPLTPGEWLNINFVGVGKGITTLDIYAEDYTTLLTSATIEVPEPLTIALMGLGGLFLRRRK